MSTQLVSTSMGIIYVSVTVVSLEMEQIAQVSTSCCIYISFFLCSPFSILLLVQPVLYPCAWSALLSVLVFGLLLISICFPPFSCSYESFVTITWNQSAAWKRQFLKEKWKQRNGVSLHYIKSKNRIPSFLSFATFPAQYARSFSFPFFSKF